jgi:hypothetical protein
MPQHFASGLEVGQQPFAPRTGIATTTVAARDQPLGGRRAQSHLALGRIGTQRGPEPRQREPQATVTAFLQAVTSR